MKSNYDYDLFVIGTGEAGSTAAQICSAAGWKVAISDDHPFGGTCSLRGCNPKRTLAGAAELVYRTAGMKGKGIDTTVSIDWGNLIAFKKEMTSGITSMHEEQFASAGIDMYHGFGTFTGVNQISIGGKVISSGKILIASGSTPRPLGIDGEQYVMTSDELLDSKQLPDTVVFIGAGYISMELSHILAASGCKVILLEYAQSPLLNFDRDLVKMLVEESIAHGIEIHVNVQVQKIEKKNGKYLIVTSSGATYEGDMVVHGAGRVPKITGLKLENADIHYEKYRIKVNEYLQSATNRNVYVAGDAHAEGIQLTPVAEQEGIAVAHNMLYGNSIKPDYNVVPSVVFIFPQIGMAGESAHNDKLPSGTEIFFVDTSLKRSTQRLGMNRSALKVLYEKAGGKIRGIHMLGYNIDEVINLFAQAIRSQKTIRDLEKIPFTFPSVTYDTVMRIRTIAKTY
ncbi:MAG TPA: NAD(P)/FAD-dependent oxidoreductase [Chitinispirillaceae bacterium]|nr:NAD(P)/FAD-dependent oxidoreductase [Chitinispirillaceae bacterium]